MTRPIAKAPTRQRLVYTLGALAFIFLGLILLGHNLHLWPEGPLSRMLSFWPGLLIGLGLFVVGVGRFKPGLPLPTFAIERGEHAWGQLQVSSGSADVRLTSFAGLSQLAVGQFPNYAGPRLLAEGDGAQLILDRRSAAPLLLGDWSLSLAKGLPWTCDLRSGLGNCELNLRDLNVTTLNLRSFAGDADLTLPATGQGEMDLRLTLGSLTLRVPEGVGVKIKLSGGLLALARVTLDPQRFLPTAPSEWSTPNFSAAPHQFSLSIALTTGDLRVV